MGRLDDFDPNNKKKVVVEWATYIPARTTAPKFKTHANRGNALNAIGYGTSNAILYRWVDNEWKEIYRTEDWKHPDNCENCGSETKKFHQSTYSSHGWTSNNGYRIWVDKKTDSPRQIWACYDCARQLRRR